MKNWARPEIETLGMDKTEHNWIGLYKDGGYVGDGEISGHLTWCEPKKPTIPSVPATPLTPATPITPERETSNTDLNS